MPKRRKSTVGGRLQLELAVDEAHRCVERERNARAGRLQLAAHVHVSVSQPGDASRPEAHRRMQGDEEEVG